MRFRNSTALNSAKLRDMFIRAVGDWPHDEIDVSVRNSRGADFSGACYYKVGRIYVNIGRHVQYPYQIKALIARPRTEKDYWWREVYTVSAADASQLALFVFMHEFYHWLVRLARRNMRQKEARCDRFATRALVDGYGAVVLDASGKPAPRDSWDIQDLDGFVSAARRRRQASIPTPRVWAYAARTERPHSRP